MKTAAEAQKTEWLSRSWDGGNADGPALIELRCRADAYLALEETTYEQICSLNGDTPQ